MQNPSQYKIPNWFLNRQKDIKDGKYSQVIDFPFLELQALLYLHQMNESSDHFHVCIHHSYCFGFQMLSTSLDNKLREDLERLKKIRLHRGTDKLIQMSQIFSNCNQGKGKSYVLRYGEHFVVSIK